MTDDTQPQGDQQPSSPVEPGPPAESRADELATAAPEVAPVAWELAAPEPVAEAAAPEAAAPEVVMPMPAPEPAPVAWVQPELTAGPAPGLEFAPHGERLVAYIFDVLILGVVYVLAMILLVLLAIAAPVVGVPLVIVAAFLIPFLYFPWFWARGGQTPGMKVFGLHVVRDRDGGTIGWGAAILRLIGFWVDSIVFYLGFIWIFIDKRRRAWHDLIAGTIVVKRPKV